MRFITSLAAGISPSIPSVFHSKLDTTQPVDRWYNPLRGNRTRCYAVLILPAGCVTVLTTLNSI